MQINKTKWLLTLTLMSMTVGIKAGEKEDLLMLRNTTVGLIQELVKNGILSQKAADDMIQKAKVEAEAETKEQQNAGNETIPPADSNDVRVTYVPQFVKDEIRHQVRSELREEVVGDVMQKAKNEQWGIPDALPDWVSRFKLSGDLRLRSQNDFMSNDNIPPEVDGSYLDYQAINAHNGRFNNFSDFLNTTKDRHRFRERLRLAIDAKITDNIKAGIRLATSNLNDPVSTNQSLGNTGNHYEFSVDRAYLKYDAVNDEGFKWLTLAGGRIADPWYVGGGEFTGGSELVWDTDLSFEGFALTTRHSLGSSKSVLDKHDDSRHIFATAGAFPLQETELSSSGKWLVGGQVGLNWGFVNQDAFKIGLAYYDYLNIQAKKNSAQQDFCGFNTAANNFSVPQFKQFGNTMTGICRGDTNGDGRPDQAQLFGLASDYNIINLNMSYDFAKFAPYHLIASFDFAKNVGFNKNKVNALNPDNNRPGRGIDDKGNPIGPILGVEDKTTAWQVRLDFGWPKVDGTGEWNTFAFYKYVEQDAVLDAFTDSDFHLGGTNAKGWVIGGNYGLFKNVWVTGRWLSADVINGPRYGIDVLQLDLNAKF